MILVTGATGFLGAHLVCQLLKAGKNVRAIRRSTSSMHEFMRIAKTYALSNETLQQVEWCEGDILDIPSLEDALNGISTVYHCAAMVSFHQKDKDKMMKVNVEGTANMVNMALLHGVTQFCFVSSIAALGRAKSPAQIDEETKWVNSTLNSNYAVSKYKAEMEVWRGIEEGLQAVIVNPGVIIGTGDWSRGSCKLFDIVWNNMPFYSAGVNGYVDVKDVCRAMIELVRNEKWSQRFVLVGQNMEIKYFMHTCARLLHKKPARFKVTPLIAELAWILFAVSYFITRKKPAITKETARASLNQYFYSAAKIEREISFRFTPIEETLTYICTEFLNDKRSNPIP